MFVQNVRRYLMSNRRGQNIYVYNLKDCKAYENMAIHNGVRDLDDMDDSDDKINFITKMTIENTDKNQIIKHITPDGKEVSSVKCRKNNNKQKTEVVNVS